MHDIKVNGLKKITGFVLLIVVLISSCTRDEKGYHESEFLLNKLENGELLSTISSNATKPEQVETAEIETQKLVAIKNDVNILGNYQLNPQFNLLKQISNLKADLKKKEATILLDSLTAHQSFSKSFPHQYFYAQCLLLEELQTSHLRFIQKTDPSKLSSVDLYYFIASIAKIGSNGLIGIDIELRLALLHYAIYLIHTEDKAKQFNSLKAGILFTKARQLTAESNDYEQEVERSYRASRTLFEKANKQQQLSLIDWHLQGTEMNLEEVMAYQNLGLPTNDMIQLLIDLANKLLDRKEVESANVILLEAQSILGENKCNIYHFLVHNLLGHIAKSRNKIDKAINYFNEAKNIGNCGDREMTMNHYLYSRWTQPILNEIRGNNIKQENYKTLLEERNTLEPLLADDPKHWDDYLAEFSIRVLENYSGDTIADEATQLTLLSASFESKERAFQSRRQEDLAQHDRKKMRKVKLLDAVAEFKHTKDYGAIAYKEILDFKISEFINTKYELLNVESSIDKNTLLDISRKNIQVLGFNTFKARNVGFYLFENELKVFQLDTTKLYKICNHLNKTINNKQDFSKEILQLRQYLLSHFLPKDNSQIFISTDGVLSFIPWHLVFENNQNIVQAPSLDFVLHPNKIIIDKDSIAIFSYSNEETKKNNKPITILELPSGYKECVAIANKIGPSDAIVYTGKACNRENLLQSAQFDLIHFASHAYSNEDNRLANHLILRNQLSEPDSLYSYEIEALGISPKVIILSACETNLGMQRDGMGTYSLSNAFLKNGTQTVVSTLWKVNDQKTANFMEYLYTRWSTGLSLQEALIQSRQHFKATGANLKDWAGFVIEGNGVVYIQD